MGRQQLTTAVVFTNAGILILLALYFVLAPAATVVRDVSDPNIRQPGVPRSAVRLFKRLTPRYERWARERLASNRAAQLTTGNISGTEWPLFGSVFYLWAAESLQQAWEQDRNLMPVAPKEYARDAIDAAARLVIDPGQAAWVREHWGESYLQEDNVFYRMLIIGALTAHANLTGSEEHLDLLRAQVEGLSAQLDASPHGILDDYPGQCYPADVLTAIACILRADPVLGTDHSEFAAREIRGFQGESLDERGLVPYAATPVTGDALGPSRGCGNSYVSLFAPTVWPEQAAQWYALYEEYFWQERGGVAGFREFPSDLPGYDWYADVDAGPVLMGFGVAASAFGVGAARTNGRFDHAYPLTAEMLAASWPLPDGTLAGPRILSNAIDAPYLGEAAILFNLTRMPHASVEATMDGAMPAVVPISLSAMAGLGLLLVVGALLRLRRYRHRQAELRAPFARLQAAFWLALLVAAVTCLSLGRLAYALLPLLATQLLPHLRHTEDATTEESAG